MVYIYKMLERNSCNKASLQYIDTKYSRERLIDPRLSDSPLITGHVFGGAYIYLIAYNVILYFLLTHLHYMHTHIWR